MGKNIGLTEKIKGVLMPYLDECIVYNRLEFIESKKFNVNKKSLYLIFGAWNNALNQMQQVTYEPKTGYVHVTLHFSKVELK